MKKCNIDRSHYLFDNQALVSLIVPLIIEQLLTVLVGMADSIMVANVGEAAVSGVSLVDQIMVLLINIFAALATGGAVVAGQYLGQKNKEQACKSTTQLMWSMGFISLVITAFVYACKYWVLHGVFGQIEASCRCLSSDRDSIYSIYRIVQWWGSSISGNGKFRSVHEGVIAYECNQCKWKCNLNLRVSLRNRRCCDSNASVQICSSIYHNKTIIKG